MDSRARGRCYLPPLHWVREPGTHPAILHDLGSESLWLDFELRTPALQFRHFVEQMTKYFRAILPVRRHASARWLHKAEQDGILFYKRKNVETTTRKPMLLFLLFGLFLLRTAHRALF